MFDEAVYVVSNCDGDSTLPGIVHGSDDGATTICGKELASNCKLIANPFGNVITCKECLLILNEYPELVSRYGKTLAKQCSAGVLEG